MKVFIAPQFNQADRGEGGIRRVVEAQIKYLPEFGIEVVDSLTHADLTVGHGILAPRRKDIPFVNINHGMHWRDYQWGLWAHEVNGMVRDAMLQADAITVPSQWVKRALSRGVLRDMTVVYHGVDPDEWKHRKTNHGYVLWNKGRADQVSNPHDMNKVAELLTDVQFRSTFGLDTDNVTIFGHQNIAKMKPIIQRAGVYLATARETFGVGTLEALASGVPVAGWDYGGQHEIIIDGETGYLAPYGNYSRLAECIRLCLQHRDRLSQNAVEDVRSRWQWRDKIKQYADIFQGVYDHWRDDRPAVSVIVTAYNLGRYLPDALSSLLEQSLESWECIIVDDQSTDNTAEIAKEFCNRDQRFKYHKTPSNLKLCGALNFGFERSTGKYVVNLDADNMLPANALELQVNALENDPTIHIVCGDIDLINEDGSKRSERAWHNKSDYDWRAQLAHINQIHSGAMMRREVREQTGGYRERYWRAEDAHFWTLATSLGFRAKIVTDESTLIYRFRNDSKSAYEYSTFPDKDGDWCIDFPYRLSSTASEGARVLRETTGVPNAHAVPFAAQGRPTINNGFCWNVFHNENPLVSVIIPVGKEHKRYALDALDSLMAQDFVDWEAVVINDTSDEWDTIQGAPFARVVRNNGDHNPARARNVGVHHARGKLLYFLDADDQLTPGATLRRMIKEYIDSKLSYIYTDYIHHKPENHIGTLHQFAEYNQGEWKAQHAVNILIARDDFIKAGGFDESIEGWEEWDLFLRLAINGYCGKRLPIAGFIYRFRTGSQREKSFDNAKGLLAKFKARYSKYYDGVNEMGKCCGGNGDAVLEAKAALERAGQLNASGVFKMESQTKFEQRSGLGTRPVRMEFIGERTGAVTYFGNEGRQYRGGNNPMDKYANVHPADVQKMEMTSVWRVVKVEPPPPEIPVAEPVMELPIQEIAMSEAEPATMFDEMPTDVAIAVLERSKKRTTRTKKAKRNE